MQLAATNQMQMNAHATDDLDQANEYVKRAQQHANRQAVKHALCDKLKETLEILF